MMRNLVFLLLVLLPPGAALAEPVDDLVRALAPIERMQGSFRQRQYDDQGELLLESSGRFSLLKPDYFRWEILAPDSQLIVADPEFIWHHDRDLETVTRRPLASVGDLAPLQVLGGDMETLRDSFTVSAGEGGAYLLRPMGAGASFRELMVELQDGQIRRMRVLDNLDQRLDVEFADVDTDSALEPAAFHFIPPPGADLFYHD